MALRPRRQDIGQPISASLSQSWRGSWWRARQGWRSLVVSPPPARWLHCWMGWRATLR